MPETPELRIERLRVTGVRITPVAAQDPPLLNAVGVHQPYALRAVIELHTDVGLVGLGEAYGDDPSLARLHAAARVLPGCDPFDLHELQQRVTLAPASCRPTCRRN